jgi:pentatricopeptide repeat protein
MHVSAGTISRLSIGNATHRPHATTTYLGAPCSVGRAVPCVGTLHKIVTNGSKDVICRVAAPRRDDLEGVEEVAGVQATERSESPETQLANAALFGDAETCICLLNRYQRLNLGGRVLKQLVSGCFKRGKGKLALEVVLSLPKLDRKHFSVLMKECIDRGNMEVLDRVIEARVDAGFPRDLYTHTARITTLGNQKESTAALSQLQVAMDDPRCSKRIELYNSAISACVKSGDYTGAMYVWGLVAGQHKAVPDVVTFNSMIKVAGSMGNFDEVKHYFGMIFGNGLVPTSWTYAAVFTAAAACRVNDAEYLLSVFDAMIVQPNDFILSSFFSAMSYPSCSKSDIDVVFRLLERSRGETSTLNDITYTAFVTFLARQDMPERAIDVWDAARKDEIQLSPHFFSALFSACSKSKDRSDRKRGSDLLRPSETTYNMAFDAFDEFTGWWISLDPLTVPKHVVRDARMAYNSFLHFLGVVGEHDVAQLIFESMKSQGPEPDVVTYNTMLSTLGSSKDAETALQLYWEMVHRGLVPTEKTFGSLLHVFASIGDADAAKTIFESLSSSGIVPNSILYTSFIHAAVRHGKEESLSLAFDLANEMRGAHIPLTEVTYGCLLVACEKRGDVSSAFQLYQQALEERVTPSDEMHNILISVCTRCGKLDEALDLVKSMARKHSNIQQHTMNSLTRALSIESPSKASRMLSLMTTMGMHPSRKTRLEVLKQCALAGDVTEALNLFNSGVELDGPSGSALIISLCAAQKLDDAVGVYETMMAAAWRKMDRMKEEKKTSLPKRALEPSGSALASLAQAHAATGLLSQAWKFYLQLRRKPQSLETAVLNNRRMFEVLIEGQCRLKNLKKALVVFDDWKSASSSLQHTPFLKQLNLEKENSVRKEIDLKSTKFGSYKQYPRLSYLALAYLEASCNSDEEHAWRVYDILATMRAMKESKRQSELARPSKRSHHF